MQRRAFLAALAVLAASGTPAAARDGFLERLLRRLNRPQAGAKPAKGRNGAQHPGGLSAADASQGLRQALRIGIDAVTRQLGAKGGFFDDPKIRIALPRTLRKARKLANPLGLTGPFDDLQARMNHGAEAAMPQGRAILKQAVGSMTIDDALAIVRGPDDSATQFLRTHAGPSLAEAFTPVVRTALDQSGAIDAGKALAGRYRLGEFAGRAEEKLTRHVVKGALNGVFYYLAGQERKIRAHPGAYASDLLERVFGRV